MRLATQITASLFLKKAAAGRIDSFLYVTVGQVQKIGNYKSAQTNNPPIHQKL